MQLDLPMEYEPYIFNWIESTTYTIYCQTQHSSSSRQIYFLSLLTTTDRHAYEISIMLFVAQSYGWSLQMFAIERKNLVQENASHKMYKTDSMYHPRILAYFTDIRDQVKTFIYGLHFKRSTHYLVYLLLESILWWKVHTYKEVPYI